MSVFQTMAGLQLTLFFMILLGVYAAKRNILPGSSRKHLSELLIRIILPCNIISSFHLELTQELLSTAGLVLAISFGTQFLYYIYSIVLYHNVDSARQKVLRYATICSNAGFLGLPIVGGVYGAQGILYTSIALIPQRVFMWSAGLSLFTKTNGKDIVRTLATHPCILAVVAGFLLMISPFPMPDFFWSTMDKVGNCTTAVSMLIIGGILAETNLKHMMDGPMIWFSAARLILIPLSVFGILSLFHTPVLITGVLTFLAGMPAGSTTAILAAQYGGDAPFASKAIFVTTLLSLVTLPLLSLLLAV